MQHKRPGICPGTAQTVDPNNPQAKSKENRKSGMMMQTQTTST